ncbi:thioredoxin-like protein [Lasiosphaeria miniovina]|uniref:Thioredoxin-like protein n=1 Tax=Lasiosphaeria miniovina TaxID=1954250 RepID=A0AA40EBA1_9PEZI|nr:thioredoxin-like protein [Lasiosphaeria miniovina]KAK0735214.1 thioredoxin-like protein [Lasiosphaeria miniovina]
MASDEIVLFDIPSKAPVESWSLNPWKTRLLLNYKGLHYRTEWLNYPQVKPRLEGHVAPHAPGTHIAPYTIPTIRLPDGTYIADSRAIADTISVLHPSPPLQIDSPQLEWLMANYGRLMTPFRGVYLPLVPRRLLADESVAYWYESKARVAGKSVADVERDEGGDVAFAAVEPSMKEATAMLKENPAGPFFGGEQVGYVDFFWAAFLLFVRRIGEDVWEKLLACCGGDGRVHAELLEAVKPWSERSTY